jgi:hypothetical protein
MNRRADQQLILALVDEVCDITRKKLLVQLAERGHSFSVGSLWPFFDRHAVSLAK